MKEFKVNEECQACDGTGLYIGMAERDGAVVVCCKCQGTGCFKFVHRYKEFTKRRTRHGVIKRVFRCNPGIIIGEGKDLQLEDFGGIPIGAWVDGKQFTPGTEDRKHTCPAWFYQFCDNEKKPDWKECWECLGMTFSHCKYFTTKECCWKRWDKENGNTPR